MLVVHAPENDSFKLEDGDVIQAIDGRKPSDGAHALRILRSYKSGEKLNLPVLRQRKPLTLAVTMPERPEFDETLHARDAAGERRAAADARRAAFAGASGGRSRLESEASNAWR